MRTYVLFFLFLASTFAYAQPDLSGVQSQVDNISNSKYLRHAQWAFVLMDLESGRPLMNHNGDASLLPASTMKTVTSGAALGILGSNYTFKTYLEIDGNVDAEGSLNGNVYIRGGGDPTLGSDRFKWGTDMEGVLAIWVEALKKKGIKSIEGSVIGDASIFEDAMLPVTWVWSDIGNYYGAGACGLAFNENLYYLYFKPHATVGESAELLRVEPEMPDIEFINEMKTGARGSGDQGYIYGAPYTYLRYLRGTVPQGKTEFSIKGSIPDPAHYAATRLHESLKAGGIALSGKPETLRRLRAAGQAPKATRSIVHTHKSPPLKDIIYWLNKKSINLYAEHLVKIIGHVKSKNGSTDAGTQAIRDYWAAKGIDVDGLHMKDGSGLSRYNGITAMQMTGMLLKDSQSNAFEDFYNSLPVAGNPEDPGSLRNLCKGTAAAKNLRAKSGYISRVRGYTGYVDTKSGKRLAFAMLANNYTCSNRKMRDMFEQLMVAMAEIP